MKKRVLLAMSGGVDSSVAALLLLKQGFEVVGLTLKVWSYEKTYFGKNGKKSDDDYLRDAQELAEKLGIDHHIADIQDQFNDTVINSFIDEYMNGRTPNPCVECNPTMKWGTFIQYADQLKCDFVATGHYVNVNRNNGRFFIQKGLDEKKDQSYVLWKLSQEQLQRTIFPLGGFHKEEIKKMAMLNGITSIANKRESYDVCFIPNSDYRSFLSLHCAKQCEKLRGGVIVDKNGKWLGKHKGYPFYTIGQRKGLEVAVGHPIYVTQLDPINNKVILGEKEDLLSNTLVLSNVNIQKYGTLPNEYRVLVRVRYKDNGEWATIYKEGAQYICKFEVSISAATPGQSAVFYEENELIGGGIIENAINNKY